MLARVRLLLEGASGKVRHSGGRFSDTIQNDVDVVIQTDSEVLAGGGDVMWV